MSKFFNDMIHMAEGEKLLEYWWLWAIIAATSLLLVELKRKG